MVNFGSIASAGSSGFGVILKSGGSVANYGSITGTGADGDGVDLSSGGSVTNAASASITGSTLRRPHPHWRRHGRQLRQHRGHDQQHWHLWAGCSARFRRLDHQRGSAPLTGVALYRGAEISGGAGVVVNKGSIASTGTSGNGVEIGYGGGVRLSRQFRQHREYFDAAIKLEFGGSTTNAASLRSRAGCGVRIYGDAGTVVNFGSIVGTIAGAGTIGDSASNWNWGQCHQRRVPVRSRAPR